jgi:hypothetical protein
MRAARLGQLLHRVFSPYRFNDLGFGVLVYRFNAIIGIFFPANLNGFGLVACACMEGFISLRRAVMHLMAVIIMGVQLIIMMMVLVLMPVIVMLVIVMAVIVMRMMLFMLLASFEGGDLFDFTIHRLAGHRIPAPTA